MFVLLIHNQNINDMQQPTDEQIKEAAQKTYCSLPSFKTGVNWLLNWQKSQPLEMFLVWDYNANIRAICRTKEQAEIVAENLKKDYNSSFNVTKYIVFK